MITTTKLSGNSMTVTEYVSNENLQVATHNKASYLGSFILRMLIMKLKAHRGMGIRSFFGMEH